MTHVTCRLTAKNRDQLRNPTLGNRIWATFTFLRPRGTRDVSDETRRTLQGSLKQLQTAVLQDCRGALISMQHVGVYRPSSSLGRAAASAADDDTCFRSSLFVVAAAAGRRHVLLRRLFPPPLPSDVTMTSSVASSAVAAAASSRLSSSDPAFSASAAAAAVAYSAKHASDNYKRGSHRPQTPPPVLPPGELI